MVAMRLANCCWHLIKMASIERYPSCESIESFHNFVVKSSSFSAINDSSKFIQSLHRNAEYVLIPTKKGCMYLIIMTNMICSVSTIVSIYCLYIYIYAQTGTFADPTVRRFELFFPFEAGVRFFREISRSIFFLRFQPIKCIRLKSIWRANRTCSCGTSNTISSPFRSTLNTSYIRFGHV